VKQKKEMEKIKEGKKKEKRRKSPICYYYHTPFYEPNNSIYLLPLLCSDREISGMILIMKNNISSYN